MSVIKFQSADFSRLAAGLVHVCDYSLPVALSMAAHGSECNARAFAERYGEPDAAADYYVADELEPHALRLLADPDNLPDTVDDLNLPYNCAEDPHTDWHSDFWSDLQDACDRIRRWSTAQQRERERADENAAAFDDVGQLPTLAPQDIAERCRAAGCRRVIIAEYRVNQSDSQSDYFGHRIARRVVIGFGKGKRENFRQLRKAAGQFPPTADLGPGCDVWQPVVVFRDGVEHRAPYYSPGQPSPWHSELDGGQFDRQEFTTEADAREFIAQQGEPEPVICDGVTVHFEWKLCHKSVEHRETYSMGGGNYLGHHRHGGWTVASRDVDDIARDPSDSWEFFDPNAQPAPDPEPEPESRQAPDATADATASTGTTDNQPNRSAASNTRDHQTPEPLLIPVDYADWL